MTAAEEGKRIQWSIRRTHWIDCTSPDTPSWSWDQLTYRIHPDDLTPPDPYRHLKDALAAGKRIRANVPSWSFPTMWDGNINHWAFNLPPECYEIEPDPNHGT